MLLFLLEVYGKVLQFHLISSCFEWRPIVLGRGGLFFSHIFFADDLVLFSKTSLDNAMVMKRILEKNLNHIGHKVSPRKSKLCFSTNMDSRVREQLGMFWDSTT